MKKKYDPIVKSFPKMIHGADYNPEQWIRTPEIWDKDMELMKEAHTNSMSVGIFSWATLEPEEGVFDFEWLDTIMDKLHANGSVAVLATPSAARPAWLAQKYPEVLRVDANRQRILFGGRHNHCYSSPIYREKVGIINRKLVERYKDHPALGVWHISNEYGGECHCELCQENFRLWLKKKYNNDLDVLNEQWWSRFWSHTYTDWAQIQSPAPHGENSVHGLTIDWQRFASDMTIDFFDHEIKPLKELTPNIPVTANFMELFWCLDYFKFAKHLDVVSWDSYPRWSGKETDNHSAMMAAFNHDLFRSLKDGQPFMLMESTPSQVNWQPVNVMKRPNQHLMSSLQAVAHGADTVQYFQWRKSRGSAEKFHGAVVDHVGHGDTRVFRDVAEVGKALEKLDAVVGTATEAEVGIFFDWDNRWAIQTFFGLRRERRNYADLCLEHYNAFWQKNIATDIVSVDSDFSKYKIITAPMMYMVKPGMAEKIEEFVKNGGTFITTYWSGIVNENDLCFLGGFPGPLKNVLGIWAEEIDTLPDDVINKVKLTGCGTEYDAVDYCERIHLQGAEAVAAFATDFYAGMPAITVNHFGKGKAYYIGFKGLDIFLSDFYGKLAQDSDIASVLDAPNGVSVRARTDGEHQYIFVMNTTPSEKTVCLDKEFEDMLTGTKISGEIVLDSYGLRILKD